MDFYSLARRVAVTLLVSSLAALSASALAVVTILAPGDGTVATADPCPGAHCTVLFEFEVEVTGGPIDRAFLVAELEEGPGFGNIIVCTPPDLIEGIPGCPTPPIVFTRGVHLGAGTWTVVANVARGDTVESSAPIHLTVFPPDIESAGPVALSEVVPNEGTTLTRLRDPGPGHPDGLTSPPTEVRIIGANLDNPFLEVWLAPIAPNEPTWTSDSGLPVHQWCTFEAEILGRGSAPGGLSFLRVAVPELPETTPVTCGLTPGPEVDIHRVDWRWIIRDNWIRPEREHTYWAIPSPRQVEAWAGAPPFRVVKPSYPRLYGFGFANHATSPRYLEFLTVYGNNAYLCVGLHGFCATRLPDPLYHIAWWPIYFLVMGGTGGSCNGMASTSLLMARGELEAGDFEVGVHCPFGFVDPGPDAVPATNTNGRIFMQGVARYEDTNFCTPFCSPPKPANLWATIRMNHGVQFSREFLLEILDTLGEAIFDPTDSIKGVPNATLERVRANPQGYVLCFFELFNGHCVTPYAVEGNRIHVYDNNEPGRMRYIEIEDDRYRYPLRNETPNEGRAIMAFPIEIWEGGRTLLGLSDLPVLVGGSVVDFLYMVAVGSGAMNVSNDAGGRWGWEADGSFSDALPGAVSIAPLGPQEVDARAMPLLLAMDQPEPTVTIHADGDGPYTFHTGAGGHLLQLEAASGAGDQDRIDLAYAASGLESFRFTPERDATRLVPRVGLAIAETERALFHWHGLVVPGGTSVGFGADKSAASVTYHNDTGTSTSHVLALDHASGEAESFGRTIYGPFEVPAGASHTVTLADWPDVSHVVSELDLDADGTADETDVVPGRSVQPPLDHGAEADLSVAASASLATVAPGEAYSRTVTVHNHGPARATDVVVLELLPPGLEISAVRTTQGECDAGAELICDLGTIPAGGTVEVTFSAAATRTGRMPSVVTAFGSEGDPDPTNNVASTLVHVASEIVELDAALGTNSPHDATIHVGDRDVAVLQVTLQAQGAQDIEITSLELIASVSAGSNSGADVLERLTVKVYHDVDGDGSVGTSDLLLATGSFSQAGEALTLEPELFVVKAGGNDHLLVALDVEAAPAAATLGTTLSLTALGLCGVWWFRRRSLPAVAALVFVITSFTACRPPPTEVVPVRTEVLVQVSLTRLAGEGVSARAPASASGLPLEGATVTIDD